MIRLFFFFFNYNFIHKQLNVCKKGGLLSQLEPRWMLYRKATKAASQLDKSKDKQADEETGNQFISRPPTAVDGDRVM